MSDEPDRLVLQLLRDMREKMVTKDDIVDQRPEMHSLRADVASDLLNMRADTDEKYRNLSDQIVGLRRTVIEYHTPSSATAS